MSGLLESSAMTRATRATRVGVDGPQVGRSRTTSSGSALVERWGLALLLVATGTLYAWRLGVSGWANPYYAAAAQAGSESWKAFFFGSLDAGNALTVDKPPLGLWPIDLSVRLLGMSSWSILLPQAVEGVATVYVLYLTVRHTTRSHPTGLVAGALLATTPVATLMFRYDNPDALMTLLLVVAAYTTVRALDSGHATAWLALAGTAVGLAFLTKMLEAFLVLPALAATYALLASGPALRRLMDLAVAAGAVVLASGWWIVTVALWPTDARPYVGGSTTNSVLQLALGYNGLSRLTGASSSTSGSALSGFTPASTNLARISRTDVGSEIVWLLPAALVLGCAALWLTRRHRDRRARAGLVMWLGWLVVSALTLSIMAGTFHSYYTIIMAPAIAALVATGVQSLWPARRLPWVRRCLATASLLTTAIATALVVDRGEQLRWLALPVVGLGILSLPCWPRRRAWTSRAATCAAIAGVLGPVAFSLATVPLPHHGPGPMAGPGRGSTIASIVVPPRIMAALPSLLSLPTQLQHVGPPEAIVSLLRADGDGCTWAAAVPGARYASDYELATGRAVIGIGGYKGLDPAPDLGLFQQWVAQGRIHYLLPDGTLGDTARAIVSWVDAHFVAQSLDGTTYYDLTAPTTAFAPPADAP